MSSFNLPDGMTLDMLDDFCAGTEPVGSCARCGNDLYEDTEQYFDGDYYCPACRDQAARESGRYCSNCGVVDRECITTAFNDEPYCRSCLLQQLTNLRRLGEIFELCSANGLSLMTPVVFVLEGDTDTTYIGTHEVIQQEKIVLHIAPISESDAQIMQAALDETMNTSRDSLAGGLQRARSEFQ